MTVTVASDYGVLDVSNDPVPVREDNYIHMIVSPVEGTVRCSSYTLYTLLSFGIVATAVAVHELFP